MELFSVLMSSCDEEDDDEEEDDDDDIELSLERMEYSAEDEDEEDGESNILSTNVDSPSNSLVIELWSCHCSSVDGGRCCWCHTCFFIYANTLEFFHPKNKHFLKKTVHAGQIFIRKYSYLKIKFHLCISQIISKLLPLYCV